MRTNIKKGLAVLLTMVMLCAMLPLSMLSASAATNLVSNGTFETDTSGWSTSATISVDTSNPASGSGSLKLDCSTVDYAWTYVKVSVSKNTDYVMTFKGKTASAGLMVNFQSNWVDISAQIPRYTVGSVSSWTDCEYEFNTGDYSSLMIYFQSSWAKGTGSTIWLDDVVIVEKVTEPEPEVPAGENLVLNGDFENGNQGWSMNSSASVVSGGYSGNAIQLSNPSAWSEAARQDVVVEPNTNYTLSWRSKRVSGSGVFNFEVAKAPYDGTKPTITALESQSWMNDTSGNWIYHKMRVLTTDANGNGINQIMLKLTTEAANSGVILLDNITLTKDAVASFDGYLYNGDFEVGDISYWSKHQGAEVSTAAKHNGNYGVHLTGNGSWGGIMSQGSVNVVAGKTYVVSYYIKIVKNGLNLQIKDGTTSSGAVLTSKSHTYADYSSWTLVSHEVTPTSNGLFINFCGYGGTGDANSAKAEDAYVDDIKIELKKEAVSDGYIQNGDFETGTKTPWTTYSSTAVSADAKYEGNYGLTLAGSGGWGGLAYQQIKNLKANQDYTITMWMKVVAGGVNVQVKGSNLDGNSIASGYRSTTNTSNWTQITLTWTADATTGYINFCGDGTNTACTVYVDSIVVSRLGGEIVPEAMLGYNGSSARDAEGTEGTGYGLAYAFHVQAINGKKDFSNKYIENSASVVLDDQEYTVVRMGAVMTNQKAVGETDFTLDDATHTTQGGKVINIPAVYLNAVGTDTVSFAVRILDIPQKHIGTTIYARPYYVYLDNGEEVTVYGDIRANNYAKASNISTADKSSIKILSIGHSFSKDVMVTNLYNMFKEGGYENVTIGYLYMAGCSMPKHLYNIQNNLAQYEYAKNTTGSWVSKNNIDPLYALQDEDWDFVTLQSSPDYIGGQSISSFKLGVNSEGNEITLSNPMTEYECITPISNWIKQNATNPNVKIDYHMIWSFSQGCELWSYTYHNFNQMTMYNNIIAKTKEFVVPHAAINDIIPSATAIQNARSSFMGDNFNMPDASQGGNDGYHLNDDGDYVAALTWYCHYSGDNANIMAGYTGVLTADEFVAVAEAVNNAMETWDKVTESTHK